MSTLVLTIIGTDREGLLSALSSAVHDHGGNWLQSELARLAGKFVGIAIVDVPDHEIAGFSQSLAGLRGEIGLRVETSILDEDVDATDSEADGRQPVGSPLHLELVGLDRPGMVREVTSALAAQGATVDGFRSWTSHAPEGGGQLFHAVADVRLREGTDDAVVREALERIADELMVDLELDAPGIGTQDRGSVDGLTPGVR
ncbi:transcriptional regulator [Brachybacterium sp. EF45031]|uniref:glycine cleavage system protein R n=1 Tax=Brachybacterium sillae TaxID=2810536 RepID=UPI00217DCA04|nr:ACT domain-containing protein [Brachybacterium sillae]MCS6710867.1 transcriptional regulator [Brachybacterium sillae]